jgi:hypothetical protein
VWVNGVPWRMPPVANIDALVEWSDAQAAKIADAA